MIHSIDLKSGYPRGIETRSRAHEAVSVAIGSRDYVVGSSADHSTVRVYRRGTSQVLWTETERERGGCDRLALHDPLFAREDHDLLAVGARDGRVLLYDAGHGELLHELEKTSKSKIVALCFSPDGTKVAAAGSDAQVTIWSAKEGGEPLIEFEARAGQGISTLVFADKGPLLAIGHSSGLLEIWDLKGRLQRAFPRDGRDLDDRAQGSATPVSGVVFDEEVVLWSVFDRVYHIDLASPRQDR